MRPPVRCPRWSSPCSPNGSSSRRTWSPGSSRSMRSSWPGATASWGRSFGNRRSIARRSPRHAGRSHARRSGGSRGAAGREGPVRGGPAGPPPLAPGERPPCGLRIGPGNMIGGGVMLAQLTNTLSPFVNRVVLDRTGLMAASISTSSGARPTGTRHAPSGRSRVSDRCR